MICVSPPPLQAPLIIHLLSCLIPVLNLVVLLVVLIDYMDDISPLGKKTDCFAVYPWDISFSKRRKNRGYTYLCAGSVICVSLLRAPQNSTLGLACLRADVSHFLCCTRKRPGGDSYMKQTGMLVGNFEFNPKRRPSGRGSSFL